MNARVRGWCPTCSEPLHDVMVNLRGTCSTHGIVSAEFEPAPVVVDTEGDSGVIGVFVRTEEDAIFYRRPDGSVTWAPADCVEIREGTW